MEFFNFPRADQDILISHSDPWRILYIYIIDTVLVIYVYANILRFTNYFHINLSEIKKRSFGLRVNGFSLPVNFFKDKW